MKFLILNGPNLNLLGLREPAIYGRETYEDLRLLVAATAARLGVEADTYQSNHEGALVDAIRPPTASTTESSSTRRPTPTPASPCWTP